jgi:hypothetical protein
VLDKQSVRAISPGEGCKNAQSTVHRLVFSQSRQITPFFATAASGWRNLHTSLSWKAGSRETMGVRPVLRIEREGRRHLANTTAPQVSNTVRASEKGSSCPLGGVVNHRFLPLCRNGFTALDCPCYASSGSSAASVYQHRNVPNTAGWQGTAHSTCQHWTLDGGDNVAPDIHSSTWMRHTQLQSRRDSRESEVTHLKLAK